MSEIRIDLPMCYYGFCKDSENRAELYKRYVTGFLKKYHPNMKLVTMEPVKAGSRPYVMCKRIEEE